MDAISRRYRKPKGRPSKRREFVCIQSTKEMGKNHMQSDSDSTMRAKNSDILLAENSLMDTEISISDEGSHADITVSYDGTWQKRGHSSLYGIGIVIDILTGLVIDYEILSKYCPECTTAKRDLGENSAEYSMWYKSHQEECSKNYVGSSNAMEVKAAEILWKRSIKNCGMRYVSILSDGDAKTYQHLSSLNVYGNCIKIAKEECINHVAKRLGTGLRNKILEWRNKGITIGGRKEGNLKENTIVKLTNFYRKAIKDNAPDRLEMGVISAIGGYNFGCFNSLAIEHNELSSVSADISHKRDKRRLAQSEKRILVIGERKE
ncbi:uncharacterized protein TNCV_4966661 [Trichonephila clavipes]|nr:uncharacterized protein TNCV_4966661 [Trichonephila clavipes]